MKYFEIYSSRYATIMQAITYKPVQQNACDPSDPSFIIFIQL